jgi:hypothetical protein
MECSKWEEIGLLYCSNELNRQEAREFEEHLKACSECSQEHKIYLHEKATLYTVDILGETPSAAVSDEILRVCKDGRRKYTTLGFFPSLFKKGVFSATFFAIGFIVVSYFIFTMQRSGTGSNDLSAHAITGKSDSIISPTAKVASSLGKDSLRDSSNDSAVHFSRSRGTLEVKGVVPVTETSDK